MLYDQTALAQGAFLLQLTLEALPATDVSACVWQRQCFGRAARSWRRKPRRSARRCRSWRVSRWTPFPWRCGPQPIGQGPACKVRPARVARRRLPVPFPLRRIGARQQLGGCRCWPWSPQQVRPAFAAGACVLAARTKCREAPHQADGVAGAAGPLHGPVPGEPAPDLRPRAPPAPVRLQGRVPGAAAWPDAHVWLGGGGGGARRICRPQHSKYPSCHRFRALCQQQTSLTRRCLLDKVCPWATSRTAEMLLAKAST